MMFKALYYDTHMKDEIVASVQVTIDNALMKARLDTVLGGKDNIIRDQPKDAAGLRMS